MTRAELIEEIAVALRDSGIVDLTFEQAEDLAVHALWIIEAER